MGIRGEEVHAKGIYSIFNKIIAENFPNYEKDAHSGTPRTHNQNRTSPEHIIFKTTSTENKERILKSIREKNQIIYKGKAIKITAYFSTET
jgi:hypothetical protein